ncbi:hypothetical protein GCM10007231_30100 [Nocardioides daphniae]|uniref:Uncharacterized protein n=1 Tax=Nocardioides daphniae TaxID=402297 RepID=A0ABQ1QID5_9ACTN|nr:hypothetical protein GCM10007231_30100 [Nocardioides daphniae]
MEGGAAPRARTWVDGVETTTSPEEWDRTVARFLGFGHRVVLPPGEVGSAAAQHALGQVRRLAALLDARVDEAPWSRLATTERGQPVEVVGGWEHRFRQSPGVPSTRVTPLPTVDPGPHRARGVELPWPVNEHSPTAGLPMVSSHADALARQRLASGEVGLWRNDDGLLVGTTAGVPLLLTTHGWAAPSALSGAVWPLVPDRVRRWLGAADLTPTHVVLAVACVDPCGGTTWLTELCGRALPVPPEAEADLAAARTSALDA